MLQITGNPGPQPRYCYCPLPLLLPSNRAVGVRHLFFRDIFWHEAATKAFSLKLNSSSDTDAFCRAIHGRNKVKSDGSDGTSDETDETSHNTSQRISMMRFCTCVVSMGSWKSNLWHTFWGHQVSWLRFKWLQTPGSNLVPTSTSAVWRYRSIHRDPREHHSTLFRQRPKIKRFKRCNYGCGHARKDMKKGTFIELIDPDVTRPVNRIFRQCHRFEACFAEAHSDDHRVSSWVFNWTEWLWRCCHKSCHTRTEAGWKKFGSGNQFPQQPGNGKASETTGEEKCPENFGPTAIDWQHSSNDWAQGSSKRFCGKGVEQKLWSWAVICWVWISLVNVQQSSGIFLFQNASQDGYSFIIY